MYHGRKKQPKIVMTEDEKKANAEMLEKIKGINKELLQRRAAKSYTEDNLELTEKAGALSSDGYTIWNYRRELIEACILKSSEKEPRDKYAFLENELKTLLKLLIKNPKSYALWFHRGWCIQRGLEIEKEMGWAKSEIMKSELGLCAKLHKQDERNFHCWNYKSWLLTVELEHCKKDNPDEAKLQEKIKEIYKREYDYTTSLITHNFSNYSAWYYRSKMLPHLFNDSTYLIKKEKLKEELEMLKQAFYTEPKDQSCWNHHRWLVSILLPVQVVGIHPLVIPVSELQFSIALSFSHKIYSPEGIKLIIDGEVQTVSAEMAEAGVHNDRFKINITLKAPAKEFTLEFPEGEKFQTIESMQPVRPISLTYKQKGEYYVLNPSSKSTELDSFLKETLKKEVSGLKELIEIEEGLVYAIERLCDLLGIERDYFGNPLYGSTTPLLHNKEVEEFYNQIVEYKKSYAIKALYVDLIDKYSFISDSYAYIQSILSGKSYTKIDESGKKLDILPYTCKMGIFTSDQVETHFKVLAAYLKKSDQFLLQMQEFLLQINYNN